ncbi:MAG: 5'/3'-nucleotidase SurE [Deltaproteobacteria bacterium]|nr:5'/3'-nucleotidase SurE [Deltaproteobacteria bacterium]MBI3294111.1 5'/3'-nucleotidase SurE [Deltaproteobacteria bacterium]
MKILISNDDGMESHGIHSLAKNLKKLGEVTVVAPHRERSTAGHSLTLHKPLRITNLGDGKYATSGTPADCIYLGMREVMKSLPDVIVSGVNRGANLGTDIHYSGTVAAAREGALMNIPSYAFSLVDLSQTLPNYPHETFRFEMAGEIALEVLQKTIDIKFPAHTLLNINIPNMDRSEIKGMKITRQGFRFYSNEVSRRSDPRGKDYYWLGGHYLRFEGGEDTDCHVLNDGYVTITPITIDCTHNQFYATLVASAFND